MALDLLEVEAKLLFNGAVCLEGPADRLLGLRQVAEHEVDLGDRAQLELRRRTACLQACDFFIRHSSMKAWKASSWPITWYAGSRKMLSMRL